MIEQVAVEQNPPQRTVIGKVVSNKMQKTIVVQVERQVKHPLYGKYVRRFSKMYAHDEENTCQLGDTVLIRHSRPLSKTKRWVLVEVLKREEQE
jgi:small subunit ribosomal protein S17